MIQDEVEEVKSLAIVAMFSDDDLMNRLVLKGGNLLDLVYGVSPRASMDVDFSLESDFAADEVLQVAARIESALQRTFRSRGYEVFDVRFRERPEERRTALWDFWGGYRVEFKAIRSGLFRQFRGNALRLRLNAVRIGPRQERTICIDISKWEYCRTKDPVDFRGYRIFVYSPLMCVAEKLRAICQQRPVYCAHLHRPFRTPRARDFVDIHTLCDRRDVDLNNSDAQEMTRCNFAAKQVPLHLIGEIGEDRDFHKQDFQSVIDTVKPGVVLQPYDFYFDYVVERCCGPLEPLWKEQAPPL